MEVKKVFLRREKKKKTNELTNERTRSLDPFIFVCLTYSPSFLESKKLFFFRKNNQSFLANLKRRK